MAARAIWKGVVRIGPIATPVKLYAAVQDRNVRFRLLERRTQAPVRQVLVDPEREEEVAYEEARRGYVTDDDELVLLDPDELAGLEPEASRDIEVAPFLPPAEIDHRWYDRPYYLGPDGDLAAYTALAAALTRSGREGVARWTMRTKAYVGALRAHRGYPVLVTLRHAEAIVPVERVERPAWKPLDDRQLAMARQLIEMLEAPFEPDAYRDEHRDRVLAFLAAKRAGAPTETKKPRRQRPTGDLERALERSLAAGRPHA
jgi:DNA end-binding protein Ku